MKTSNSTVRDRFGFQFVELARRWRRALDAKLAEAGLTDATWAPLIHRHELGDGIHQKELAERVGLDGSSLVRLLDILAERELIERREDEQDRRAKRVYLTRSGKKAVKSIQKVLGKVEREMLSDVTEGDLAQASATLGKISARVQRILDARRSTGQ
jgi:MarR family transcriptional regulator for hemolysin